jgi:N-acetylglucosaminyldiphosphoundecaprenol N-acetyl-beta-D-mannosaminyltransferase
MIGVTAATTRQVDIKDKCASVDILGVRVDALTYGALLDRIAEYIVQGTPRQIATVNPEFVMLAQQNPVFAAALRGADLCMADGYGLLWAARRLGRSLPERVTGSDGLPMIAERAAQTGWRLYLLGARPGVAAQTAEILTARYPGLQIVGVYPGSPADDEAPGIIERIRVARPDVLFVAYGAPAQDVWIDRHRAALGVPVMMGVGGAFDHIAGVQRRAPAWVRRIRLEWLFRLITQPWRWRRQLALPRFVWAVLRAARRVGPAARRKARG